MIKAILTDLEGTITRKAFVRHILYPYAKQNLADFVDFYQYTPKLKEQLDKVKAYLGNSDADIEEVTGVLLGWLKTKQDHPALVEILGMVWKNAYHQHDITGHVYADAYEFMLKIKEYNREIYSFSVLSKTAQQALFSYSEFGDISSLIDGVYDSTVGSKTESDSYKKILMDLSYQAHEILFLSDSVTELNAAKSLGMKTCQLVRDGQANSEVHAWTHDMRDFPWMLLNE